MLWQMIEKSQIPNSKLQTNPKFQITKFKPFLAVLSAVLLILSFPNFNLGFLAWVALVPLFFAIENQRPLKAFLIAYFAGAVFFLGTIYWLIHVTFPGMLIVVLYLALYVGIFGLIASYGLRVTPPKNAGQAGYGLLFYIPASWVALEWLRSNAASGFGWAILAHSQSRFLPIIQIADITGAYGVSFLIVMANAALYSVSKNLISKRPDPLLFALPGLILFVCLSYGFFRLNNIFTGTIVKVAVVQGNIPQDRKWDPDFRDEILSKYKRLTDQAADEKTELVIWPETAVPGFLDSEPALFEAVRNVARRIRKPLLAGAPREGGGGRYYNSAFLFTGAGQVEAIYDKIHLVPFGEYVPFKKVLFFVDKFAPRPIGDFTPGEEYTVFTFPLERRSQDEEARVGFIKNVRFSCLICFEDIFPSLTRNFVKNGAQLLVNITNDAWFKASSAPYQHAQNSVFRAVENRVGVLRAANTGVSCIIDHKGKMLDIVKKNGKALFVDGYIADDITITKTRTFYTTYGDIFALACLGATLLNLFALRKKGKR